MRTTSIGIATTTTTVCHHNIPFCIPGIIIRTSLVYVQVHNDPPLHTEIKDRSMHTISNILYSYQVQDSVASPAVCGKLRLQGSKRPNDRPAFSGRCFRPVFGRGGATPRTRITLVTCCCCRCCCFYCCVVVTPEVPLSSETSVRCM